MKTIAFLIALCSCGSAYADLHYYLVDNIHHDEPPEVKALEYVHVKSKNDKTLIITQARVHSKLCHELSRNKAQEVLNGWAVQENNEPPPTGGPTGIKAAKINHKPVDLNTLIIDGKIHRTLAEAIKLERIRRKHVTDKDRADFKNQISFRKAYPLSTLKKSPAEVELLYNAHKKMMVTK